MPSPKPDRPELDLIKEAELIALGNRGGSFAEWMETKLIPHLKAVRELAETAEYNVIALNDMSSMSTSVAEARSWLRDTVVPLLKGTGPAPLSRAERHAGQVAHIVEHYDAFVDHAGVDGATPEDSVSGYLRDYPGLHDDIYQRLCEDLGIEPKPELCHPDPQR